MNAKAIARKWLPPPILEWLKPVLGKSGYYSGEFADWKSARDSSTGYAASLILDRVRRAVRAVRDGSAVFERDSVLFDNVQHSFPVLAGILRAMAENNNRLSVLDFGGSLGSSYFQCRDFLAVAASVKWGIVEQGHFISVGKAEFETSTLQFFDSIDECVTQISPNVILLSGVLQYLPQPYRTMDELIGKGLQYVVIDRTPISELPEDHITVQHVPPSIYPASYPCHIFSRQNLLDRWGGRYDLLAQFDGSDGQASVKGIEFRFGGLILRLR